jgi:hypothetical protein
MSVILEIFQEKATNTLGKYQDFVGISLGGIMIEGFCRWKLLNVNCIYNITFIKPNLRNVQL